MWPHGADDVEVSLLDSDGNEIFEAGSEPKAGLKMAYTEATSLAWIVTATTELVGETVDSFTEDDQEALFHLAHEGKIEKGTKRGLGGKGPRHTESRVRLILKMRGGIFDQKFCWDRWYQGAPNL